jgi:hypothetical protein
LTLAPEGVKPDAFYAAYGVRHFDYYVDFLDDRDPFKASVVDRLLGQGARVVCVIRDGGRPIGRILSFRAEAPIDLEYRLAARGWDRAFAWPRTLLQQPLTGGAYHFNYNWRAPSPAPRSWDLRRTAPSRSPRTATAPPSARHNRAAPPSRRGVGDPSRPSSRATPTLPFRD